MKSPAAVIVASLLAGTVLALAPLHGGAAPVPGAAAQAATRVAWLQAGTDADVDAAFVRARSEKRPLLLYWGAKWCPPCNHLSATLFNRRDFIERSRAFVPVYVDGDRPGAQKLGARFKVRGYPTMVLFDPQGRELSRLPGEADAPQVLALLQIGLARGRPIKAVLADARDPARARALSADEWRLLAFHSWDTDEEQLVPVSERPGLLASLAVACPDSQPATKTRLWLKALAASDEGKGVKADAALRELVMAVLADPAAAREHMDVLTSYAADITRNLVAGEADAARARQVAAFDAALQRLQVDTTLSRADRSTALGSRVELARLEVPRESVSVEVPAPLLAELRAQIARDDREIRDGYERQAVITAEAYVLRRAGLLDESDALLKANLVRSHSSYYLMSQLAGNAKARGDTAGALRWHEQAFEKSVGPATRLQWGATYVSALVDLAPQDAARIERAAQQVFSEAARQPDAFHERSGRSLQRIGNRLMAWNKDSRHDAALQRLRAQLDAVCGKLPKGDVQRGTCEAVLRPPRVDRAA
jgi:thioredoxin-like negative regulator of GroEL